MIRAQILLIATLCVVAFGKVTEAKEGGHHKISKRYTMGRVPLSYMRRLEDEGYGVDKRSSSILNDPATASHFRELQVRQIRRPDADNFSPMQLQSYQNLPNYGPSNNLLNQNEFDLDDTDSEAPSSPLLGNDDPLADRELTNILLLLEGYHPLPMNLAEAGRRPNFYTPPAQYFTQDMMEDARQSPVLGKRETGKRATVSKAQLGQEQPMSFENSWGDNYPVFLNQKRSKRVGVPPLKKRSSLKSDVASIRIKKETDPKVEASLNKIFGVSQNVNKEHSAGQQQHQHSTSIPTTAISSSDQIPAPKSKKAIDWSHYFGIDKRGEQKSVESSKASTSNAGSETISHNNDDGKDKSEKHDTISNSEGKGQKTATSTSATIKKPVSSSPTHISSEKHNDDKLEGKKEKESKSRQENETEEKDDRKWILKEFYKNLAMATNVKRKRESPSTDKNNDDEVSKLEKMEAKMKEAGDKIIWDALKYTGAHRDVELSPEELAHVKTEIIQKLAAAYSLEKIREAIEEFRQQLGQLKDKQQYY